MNILTQLSDEHEHLHAYLECIETAATARDEHVLLAALEAARPALTDQLDAHIAREESEVFDAARATHGEGLVAPFREEHIEVRALRDDVLARADRGEAPYGASLRLCDLILDHQQREDAMLFPSLREAISDGQ